MKSLFISFRAHLLLLSCCLYCINEQGAEVIVAPFGSIITNTVGIVLKRITSSDANREIYLGVYEITQSQWKAVMTNNPSFHIGSDLPVEDMTYSDAVVFAKGIPHGPHERYRLPTMNEWLKGYDPVSNPRLCEKQQVTETTNVFQTAVNSKGFYGMMDNVSEWCSDWVNRPIEGFVKAIMGNSYLDSELRAPRLSDAYAFDYRSSFIGIRIVLERANQMGNGEASGIANPKKKPEQKF